MDLRCGVSEVVAGLGLSLLEGEEERLEGLGAFFYSSEAVEGGFGV